MTNAFVNELLTVTLSLCSELNRVSLEPPSFHTTDACDPRLVCGNDKRGQHSTTAPRSEVMLTPDSMRLHVNSLFESGPCLPLRRQGPLGSCSGYRDTHGLARHDQLWLLQMLS